MTEGTPRFGEQPFPQTVAAAGAIRRLTGLLLSLEHHHPRVDDILARCAEWERNLAAVVPDTTPRIGRDAGHTQRVYLDHAFESVRTTRAFRNTRSTSSTPKPPREGSPSRSSSRARQDRARRIPRGLLRLRDPTPELRCRLSGKTRSLERHLQSTDPHPHRTAVRYRPIEIDGRSPPRRGSSSTTRSSASASSVPSPRPRTGWPVSSTASGESIDDCAAYTSASGGRDVASRLRDDILSGRLQGR